MEITLRTDANIKDEVSRLNGLKRIREEEIKTITSAIKFYQSVCEHTPRGSFYDPRNHYTGYSPCGICGSTT